MNRRHSTCWHRSQWFICDCCFQPHGGNVNRVYVSLLRPASKSRKYFVNWTQNNAISSLIGLSWFDFTYLVWYYDRSKKLFARCIFFVLLLTGSVDAFIGKLVWSHGFSTITKREVDKKRQCKHIKTLIDCFPKPQRRKTKKKNRFSWSLCGFT